MDTANRGLEGGLHLASLTVECLLTEVRFIPRVVRVGRAESMLVLGLGEGCTSIVHLIDQLHILSLEFLFLI